jgi:hypothetical protein
MIMFVDQTYNLVHSFLPMMIMIMIINNNNNVRLLVLEWEQKKLTTKRKTKTNGIYLDMNGRFSFFFFFDRHANELALAYEHETAEESNKNKITYTYENKCHEIPNEAPTNMQWSLGRMQDSYRCARTTHETRARCSTRNERTITGHHHHLTCLSMFSVEFFSSYFRSVNAIHFHAVRRRLVIKTEKKKQSKNEHIEYR